MENALQKLLKELKVKFPDLDPKIDPGYLPYSIWFADFDYKGLTFCIEWQPSKTGFGISLVQKNPPFEGSDIILYNTDEIITFIETHLLRAYGSYKCLLN